MKTILLASHNPAKIRRYRALFKGISGLELTTLADISITHKPDEPFKTAKDNAVHKAKEYGDLTGLPTLAIDEAVTANFLPDNEQPGVMVRRLNGGRELSDEEVIDAWKEILGRYPGPDRQVIWDYWVAYYEPKTGLIRTAQSIQRSRVADYFSPVLNPGYPMSRFLISEGHTRTYSELSEEERQELDRRNLTPFRDLMIEIMKV